MIMYFITAISERNNAFSKTLTDSSGSGGLNVSRLPLNHTVDIKMNNTHAGAI